MKNELDTDQAALYISAGRHFNERHNGFGDVLESLASLRLRAFQSFQ